MKILRRRILYTIGILILIFIAYSSVLAWMNPELSTEKISEIDKATETASMGFYAIDAITKQPIKGIRMSIFLQSNDDTREEKMKLVDIKYTDEWGYVLFMGLQPTATTSMDEGQNNSYVVLANDEIGQKSCDDICKKYDMSAARNVGFVSPGHYDSANIELMPH